MAASMLCLTPELQRARSPKAAPQLWPCDPPCRRVPPSRLPMDFTPGFAPTKLNVADDPTRDAPLRQTSAGSFADLRPRHTLAQLHAVSLSKWASRWVRLVLLLSILQPATSIDPAAQLHGLGFSFPVLFLVCGAVVHFGFSSFPPDLSLDFFPFFAPGGVLISGI